MDGVVNEKRYYTLKEAAEYLCMCVRQLFKYRVRGLLPSIVNGRRRLFDRVDLDKLAQELKGGGPDGQHIV